jgi:hypothetical protein
MQEATLEIDELFNRSLVFALLFDIADDHLLLLRVNMADHTELTKRRVVWERSNDGTSSDWSQYVLPKRLLGSGHAKSRRGRPGDLGISR